MFHVKHIKKYIDYTLKLADKSYKLNKVPVGAIVIYKDKIIGKGYNTRQKKHNVCGHAEINAIMQAEKKLKDWRLDECEIISTLQPCELCSKVIEESRIKKVYYLLEQPNIELKNDYEKICFPGNINIQKYKEKFNSFFKKIR